MKKKTLAKRIDKLEDFTVEHIDAFEKRLDRHFERATEIDARLTRLTRLFEAHQIGINPKKHKS